MDIPDYNPAEYTAPAIFAKSRWTDDEIVKYVWYFLDVENVNCLMPGGVKRSYRLKKSVAFSFKYV